MSLSLKMVYSCLTGAWGGLLAWVLLDQLLNIHISNTSLDALINGALIGLCIGGVVAGFQGVLDQNLAQIRRQLSNGVITGLIGGAIGLLAGDQLFQLLDQAPIARSAGWAIFGIAIGASEGISNRSRYRILLGVAGGFIGGIVGSYAFLFVRDSFAMPEFSRALGFTLLGAFIGLFVGLMPVIISATGLMGTLKVVSGGRNEGKEILLDKKVITIGCSERCDLALYGSQDVEPHHAQVERTPQGHLIRTLGVASVWVNGQPVHQHLLSAGDRIKIGRDEILFRTSEKTSGEG